MNSFPFQRIFTFQRILLTMGCASITNITIWPSLTAPLFSSTRFVRPPFLSCYCSGRFVLIHFKKCFKEPGQKSHPATKFKVKSGSGNSIQFESVHERRRFIEIAPNGQMKSAAYSSQDSSDAQFSVNVIVSLNISSFFLT